MKGKRKIIWFVILGISLITIFISVVPFNYQNGIKIGNLNNYTPIALVDNNIVYNYILDDNSFVIGNYNIDSKTELDIISEEKFYISNGIAAVIDNFVYLSITLNTNEHKLLKMDINTNTSEVLFIDYNSYPIDFISTMNDKIYMMSRNLDNNGVQTSFIRTYNHISKSMEICVEKSLNENNGEYIKAFACNDKYLYAVTDVREAEYNNTYIEVYDDDNYDSIKVLNFDDDLKDFVFNNDIVQFYCFDDYIYLRNYSDYGAIGKVEGNLIKKLLILPQLRIAYNNKNTYDAYYAFFIRDSDDFYILDSRDDTLNKINIDLLQKESIRNAITDGNNICISILDDSNTEIYYTKETLIVNFMDLLERITQSKDK